MYPFSNIWMQKIHPEKYPLQPPRSHPIKSRSWTQLPMMGHDSSPGSRTPQTLSIQIDPAVYALTYEWAFGWWIYRLEEISIMSPTKKWKSNNASRMRWNIVTRGGPVTSATFDMWSKCPRLLIHAYLIPMKCRWVLANLLYGIFCLKVIRCG